MVNEALVGPGQGGVSVSVKQARGKNKTFHRSLPEDCERAVVQARCIKGINGQTIPCELEGKVDSDAHPSQHVFPLDTLHF